MPIILDFSIIDIPNPSIISFISLLSTFLKLSSRTTADTDPPSISNLLAKRNPHLSFAVIIAFFPGIYPSRLTILCASPTVNIPVKVLVEIIIFPEYFSLAPIAKIIAFAFTSFTPSLGLTYVTNLSLLISKTLELRIISIFSFWISSFMYWIYSGPVTYSPINFLPNPLWIHWFIIPPTDDSFSITKILPIPCLAAPNAAVIPAIPAPIIIKS